MVVGRVLGCYIQNWDSLYLTSLFEPEIIRINKDCQIQEKINYEEENDGTRLYNSCFLSFRTVAHQKNGYSYPLAHIVSI